MTPADGEPRGVEPVEDLLRTATGSVTLGRRAIGLGLVGFYRRDNLTYAASIAYYTLLSLFPFLWLLVAVFGQLAGEMAVNQEGLLQIIRNALPPEINRLMTNQLSAMAEMPEGLSVVGTLLTFWASMGVFGAITSAINHAWGVKDGLGFVRHKVVAFVTMLMAGLLLVATLLLISAVRLVEATWFAGVVAEYPALEVLGGFVARNLPVPLFILAVGLIYYYVPNAKVRLRDVWLGAILAGLSWRATLWAYGWFMRDPERLMQIHGSITAVVLFLSWVYLSAVILLYGAEVTAAYARLRKQLPETAPAADERDDD